MKLFNIGQPQEQFRKVGAPGQTVGSVYLRAAEEALASASANPGHEITATTSIESSNSRLRVTFVLRWEPK